MISAICTSIYINKNDKIELINSINDNVLKKTLNPPSHKRNYLLQHGRYLLETKLYTKFKFSKTSIEDMYTYSKPTRHGSCKYAESLNEIYKGIDFEKLYLISNQSNTQGATIAKYYYGDEI